ncbi:2OG-Fe(II) oxygenase [Blastococcus litoris]|uniref:2OG-Fe(II) oxygenase n=1 Tax=Blastococcus litoris TaxID=2171622 RepID=UPI000E30240B|nr:2OG-Fe(II) oxygenase [Blastococcus litoris]
MAVALILDRQRTLALAEENAKAYAEAEPFPHIAIDDFLPPEIIKELQAEFPKPEDVAWGEFDNTREVKLSLRDEGLMPDIQLRVLRELNGQIFLDFLEKLTGIEGLVPDQALYGGGLHQIRPGGLLKVHADFNLHPRTKLQRRLNALLYLNEDWDESYGGQLELWDVTMSRPVKKILPIANRLVVFSTTSESFHGHPDPLTCPPDRTRRSMAWYYYSLPEGRIARHTTLFQSRPGESLYTDEELRRAKKDRFSAKARSMVAPIKNAVRGLRSKAGG